MVYAAIQPVHCEYNKEQVTSKVNPRHTWVVSPFPMQCRDKYHQDRGNPPRVRNRLVWRQVNSQTYFICRKQKISTASCMIAWRENNWSWLFPKRRSCSTRATMGSTIMIWKIMIWYFSTRWKKTDKDYTTDICQGPGRPGRHSKCSAARHRKPSIIWYLL